MSQTKSNKMNNKDNNLTKRRHSELIPLAIFFVIYLSVVNIWGEQWHLMVRILIAVLTYLIINKLYQLAFNKQSLKDREAERHPAYDWPTPGPLYRWGILGKMLALLTFYVSTLLSLLNPYLLVDNIRLMLGQAKIAKRMKRDDLLFDDYQNKISYRLPFNGEWLVYNGGPTPSTSHSWEMLNQRFAYDFVKADSSFSRHTNAGTKLTDYYCYGEPICAAADGEVVKVVDHIGDGPLIGFWVMDFLSRNIAGNHVIVRHADGEYGLYAHLIKGSIPFKKDDKVKQGQTIGLCGHTGNSSEPHLHFHLQDRASFYTAVGLPIRFEDVSIDNQLIESDAVLTRGTRVMNGDS